MSGSLSLSIPRYHDSLSVSASIVVHRRVGRRRALADLSAGRLGLDGFPVLDSTPRALVSETLTRAGAAGCGDTRGGSLSLLIGGFGFRPRSGVLPMLLATGSSPDPLRTHCPGPSTADLSGAAALGFQGLSGGALGQGSLALRDLGDRQIVISLCAQGRFFGEGYSCTRGGTIRFSLTLLRAGGGTRTQRIG